MRTSSSLPLPLALAACLSLQLVSAQSDAVLVDDDEGALATMAFIGADELPDPYAPLNAALGGDSIRYAKGIPCAGWVEDHYPDGTIMHRGYYGEGRLLVYRNYHPNGLLEREFKAQSSTRCSMRTWHPNGVLRSETAFVQGAALTFTEHYTNGAVRYTEEKHPSLPYYKVMDLFAPDGKPISTLHVVDKKASSAAPSPKPAMVERGKASAAKNVVFEQREYWPNGQLRASGRSQFNPHRYDSQRIGAWTYFDEAGKPVMEERYVDGKVHETADL